MALAAGEGNAVHKKFKHLLYTKRVPKNVKLDVPIEGWCVSSSTVDYGVILLDEFRTKPDQKHFDFEHANGDRLRLLTSRLQWKPHLRHMAVSILRAGTDLTFNEHIAWKNKVEWPLAVYEPDTLEFQILSLKYQKLAAKVQGNSKLLEQVDSELVSAEIEYGQLWLRRNYKPSKPKLREIQEFEFTRFVTFFPEEELAAWMENPKTTCLHWTGTRDSKTLTAMFFRSTKLSGRKVRRNSTVKELMYQFFIGNFQDYEALYLNFDVCTHKSSCCNPYHYHCMRKQKYNNCRKRKLEIANAKEADPSGSSTAFRACTSSK